MKLGLKRNEVRLVPHESGWTSAFQEVKEALIKCTSLKEYQIEHIGSTAIKEIQAKPVIDIIAGIQSIDDDITLLEEELKTCGFYRLRVERPNEIVFAKFTDETFAVKTHYIHLTDLQGELWNDLIYFRDHLNKNEVARKEYELLKMSFVKEKSEGIEAYTELKEAFINRIICRSN